MPGDPLEVQEFDGGTVADWMSKEGVEHEGRDVQPYAVTVNGRLLVYPEWTTVQLKADDDVEIRITPAGGIFDAIGSIFSSVFNFAFGWLMPGAAAPNTGGSTQQGQRLESTDAKANLAKHGDAVPEIAGTHKHYPNILTPPRPRFNSRREKRLDFMLCIGRGEYLINPADVKIGDTPFSSLGSDSSYRLFKPGEDVSVVDAHEHWHTVVEVGGTSSGTAGLEFSAGSAPPVAPGANTFVLLGKSVSIPESAGQFPDKWFEGYELNIYVPYTYNVSRINMSTELEEIYLNRFAGNFKELRPSVGLQVDVSGALSGSYILHEVSINANFDGFISLKTTNGVLVGHLGNGNVSLSINLSGRRYRIEEINPHEITVQRLLPNGAADSSWLGWNQTATSSATVRLDSQVFVGEWTNTFAACPANETTTRIEVDLFFPQGLGAVENNGNLSWRSVTLDIQYRDMRLGGAFASIRRTYSDVTLDQIGFTEVIDVPNIRPEVRIRRVGAKSTSTQVKDEVLWSGLKSRLKTATRYPNWTTMAISIRSGGRISAQSENKINVIATRILPTLQADGSWGGPVPTRDISAFVKYICRTIGKGDEDINMEELQRLHAIWKARSETLDHIFDETTVKEALSTAFGAGMSELTLDDGLITPVRDDVRTVFEQSYSPQNMTKWMTRSFTARKPGDFDGVEVEYMDATTWTREVVKCLLPGDDGFKLEKIKVTGVTDRTRAWRIGMRRRSTQKYCPWVYKFGTEQDAMNSKYLSYVPLFDDIPGYGKSSLLEHIEEHDGKALMYVTEDMTWEEGKSHVVAFRWPDGTISRPYPATRGNGDQQIIADIPKPWPDVTLDWELPHVYFGTSERFSFPALITDIRPQSNGLEVEVEARNYDVRVYAHDNETAPIE